MLNDDIQGDMWVDKERAAVRDIQVCCLKNLLSKETPGLFWKDSCFNVLSFQKFLTLFIFTHSIKYVEIKPLAGCFSQVIFYPGLV